MFNINKNLLMKNITKPDEKLLFSRVLDQAFSCSRNNKQTYSLFLNPLSCEKFCKLISDNTDSINLISYGGAEGCERRKIGFFPSYELSSYENFSIDSLEIQFWKGKKSMANHRDILGSVLGLGIDRDMVGDILIYESRAIVFADREISDYILTNLEKVGNSGVSINKILNEYIDIPISSCKNVVINVDSLRLDTVISKGFLLSRAVSAKMISSKKCMINWETITNISSDISIDDMITLRGYGRIKISEISKNDKKDKFIIKGFKYS